jgi:hypothetical protein
MDGAEEEDALMRARAQLSRPASLVALLLAASAIAWAAMFARAASAAQAVDSVAGPAWIEAGTGARLAAEMTFANPQGRLGVVFAAGPIDTNAHPFFTPVGSNGRACVTCHQPAQAMSLSAAALRERWRVTGGRDPVFAAIDGSNNPSLPQDKESSHSLLLDRGLIRVGLPWPPRPIAGRAVTPEFTIDVISDPTGVNFDPRYGFTSGQPTISVFRRPRPVANLKYVMTPDAIFNIKTGELTARDPDTGEPVGMNLMADSRHLTLKQQAVAAYGEHLQGQSELSPRDLRAIVDFESQIYVAQTVNRFGRGLVEANGPPGLGPRAMAEGRVHVLANNTRDPVFRTFEPWMRPERMSPDLSEGERELRASIARGSDIFLLRQFWLRDVAHINSIGLGNPIKRTCTTCHNAQMTGMDLAPGWVDVGTSNYPTWTEPPVFSDRAELPVFKITCDRGAAPHPYLGRTIYTTDPGRALITGRCNDVGAIVMGQFRGLAARAPYFSNGSAATLRELVDFYDRRFDMKLSETDKQDLVNFLSVL